MNGICTLANDYVYDQVIALLNSIDAIYDGAMPVCIYPYDHRVERLASAIAARPHVQIYDDQASMQRWDAWVRQVWDRVPQARQIWQQAGSDGYHRVGTHRRYCAFDGPFDRFVYMDADTLLMDALDPVFEQLDRVDWVVYDFQHKDPTHVYAVDSPVLNQVFSKQRVETEIFCSGFYGSKRGLFDADQRTQILDWLSGEADLLYPMAPDQTLLNYMVMRLNLPACNLALMPPLEQRTGCCVTSSHFQAQDHILYDRGHRLTYLHYIGVSSQRFRDVCAGQNVQFPYRDLFLHYRYRHQPDQRPALTGPVIVPNKPPSRWQRGLRKLTGLLR
jgi:hypothetical protein